MFLEMDSVLMVEPLEQTGTWWAVRVDDGDDSKLALNDASAPYLFVSKKQAREFRDNLSDYIHEKCTLIQVSARFHEVPF